MQKLLFTAALFLIAPLTRAQNPAILPLPAIHSQQQLDATILALHNAYFGAYNTCDLAKFGALTDEHVEFYHDTASSSSQIEHLQKVFNRQPVVSGDPLQHAG